ncbi:MAG: hypothetical protein HQL48_01690 [Gammaproteobacteria bacterium]|nr:hypothetical protein [Gammaproteobacteria bacterium]
MEFCKGCGVKLPADKSLCPECHTPRESKQPLPPLEQWQQEMKRVRFHWVIVVTLFWVTTAVICGLYLIHGSVYINELVFIAAIFMALGVALKTKVLRLQQKKPVSGENSTQSE